MNIYNVVEVFESINGEGKKAGQLALFIRFKGCNLNCGYCDTKWANTPYTPYTAMNTEDIIKKIIDSEIKNITLTGGEPLIQKNIYNLLQEISNIKNINVEIETNGSVDLEKFYNIKNTPSFTMDYKCGSSGMSKYMNLKNFTLLTKDDTVKFVVGSKKDLEEAKQIIGNFNLANKCSVYLSPVFKKIEPKEIVEFMKKNKMNGINLQLQLHKFIWDPNERGV